MCTPVLCLHALIPVCVWTRRGVRPRSVLPCVDPCLCLDQAWRPSLLGACTEGSMPYLRMLAWKHAASLKSPALQLRRKLEKCERALLV